MQREDVAIIGISGLYPEADDLSRFRSNLSAGRDSVREISAQRKELAGLAASADCPVMAGLDRVSEFDHAFFNISLKEAEYMDPHQRALLQLACAAIQNAGYGLKDLKGSKTAVIVSASNNDYSTLLAEPDPMAVTGNLPAALAGRISYALDLRGPAQVIDTACSSSLVAIHEACVKLSAGEVDYALAGGFNLFFRSDPLGAGSIGIASSTGRARAFDEAADGTSWGEGGGLVLLKRLSCAIEDRDNIHAVIKGGAVNQDGGRSNGLAAPSPGAQADVLAEAWKNAGVDPATIGCIEAHGTGTVLGDPIEIQGITDAFRRITTRRQFCAIGSVKTNIGHLIGAAGIAGLTKVVLSLKQKKLFPSVHFNRPNPFIDFENSPVFVNVQLKDWTLEEGAEARRAGVSSFGLSGTNAHLVLEEAPAKPREDQGAIGAAPVVISAATAASLQRYAAALAVFLKDSDAPLGDAAYTLAKGGDHYSWRYAFAATDKQHCISVLEDLASGGETAFSKSESDVPVVFLISAGERVDQDLVDELSALYEVFRGVHHDCLSLAGAQASTSGVRAFAFYYALNSMIQSFGVSTNQVIGTGLGNVLVSVITGKTELKEGLAKAAAFQTPHAEFNRAKLKSVIQDMTRDRKPVFLELGRQGVLSNEIASLGNELGGVTVLSLLPTSEAKAPLDAIAQLYMAGVSIDWDLFYKDSRRYRVELPAYQFEPTHCWAKVRKQTIELTEPTGEIEANAAEPLGLLAEQDARGLEQEMAAIWGEALKIKEISLDDDYFDLGGNSLNGAQIISRIESRLNVKIYFEDIYDYSSIRALAEYIDSQRVEATAEAAVEPSSAAPIRLEELARPAPSNEEDGLPLSSGQQRMWFLSQLEPDSPFYNIPIAARLTGSLDASALERSLNEVVRRHQVLRANFINSDGRAVQVIAPESTTPLALIDLSGRTEADREERARELAGEEAKRPFDLSTGPLLRATLIRMSASDHLVVLVMHHIISDNWSAALFIKEVAALYEAFLNRRPSPLPPLRAQYSDYAAWQRQWLEGAEVGKQLDYWKSRLGGALPVLGLPADRSRPATQSFRGGRQSFALAGELADSLKALSKREGATLFMTLLAAFKALLHRYSGQDDIIVGAPIAGRTRDEFENLIGFFVNTLALRTDLSGDPDFSTLIKRVRETALGAYANQETPFERLVEMLQPERSMSRAPIFQVLFVFQNLSMQAVDLPGLTMRIVEPESETAQFDLILSMMESEDGMLGRFEYSRDLFDAATIEQLAGHFTNLLAGAAAAPQTPISNLALLDDDERTRLLVEWNDTGVEEWRGLCVTGLFEQQAAANPKAAAVVFNNIALNYGELNSKANRLAHYLRSAGIGRESRVAICMDRSHEMIVSLLGALKAGAAYVPIDPAYPPERLAYIISDADVSVVLTQESLKTGLIEHGVPVISVDSRWEEIARHSDENPNADLSPDNAAYVIYTSGSTGKPKGVVVTHGALSNFALAMIERIRLGSGDRFLEFASLSFDASAVQIYPTLLSGAALILHEAPGRLSNSELLEFCADQDITVLDLPAGFWRQWIADVASRGATLKGSIRVFMTGGESVPGDILRTWASLVDGSARFISSYGPTEATVTTTLFRIAARDAASFSLPACPTGCRLANATVYLLDPRMQPVPIGVAGEIYIGGAGVARGYLNRPDLTAERFTPDPFTGQGARLYRTGDLARYLRRGSIEFLGRMDDQVKIRGFRVELGEIEALLQEHPDVHQAVVLARDDSPGGKRLVAYIEPEAGTDPAASELRAFIKERLPDFMVPSAFVKLERFPLTQNSKIDRQALPAPDDSGSDFDPDYVAPRNPTEEIIANICGEVLGRARVGAFDDFFAAGGHSLLATQVVSRLREAFDVELPLRKLFEAPFAAGIARLVDEARRRTASLPSQPIRPVDRGRPLPLSFAQQRLWFLDQLEPDGAAFNIPSAVVLKGRLDLQALERSFNEIVRRHEALRTTFKDVNGRPTQVINEPGSLTIPVTDLTHIHGDEKQDERRRLVFAEARQPMDLGAGPLIRIKLLRLEEDEYILLLTMHHIIFDGWSLGILLDEIAVLYEAFSNGLESPLRELPIQYADFACWQREWLTGGVLQSLLDYWRSRLEGAPPLALPADRPRPASPTFRGARRYFKLDRDLSEGLTLLSRREGVTLFMSALAGFTALLHRYGGQEDIVIGADIANRDRLDIERLMGCFFNHVVLRTDLSGKPSFRELLKRVRETTLGAYAHQDLPFDVLVESLKPERTPGQSPLFQVLFVFQNAPMPAIELSGLSFTPLEIDGGVSKFDLTLFMSGGAAEINGALEYSTEMFAPATIDRLVERFQNLLADAVRNPDAGLQSLSLGAEEESHEFVCAFNEALEPAA